MKLPRFLIVNHSVSEIVRVEVEDVCGPLRDVVSHNPRLQIVVRSRCHGSKSLPVAGFPRSGSWRVSVFFTDDRTPLTVEIDRHSVRQMGKMEVKQRPVHKHQAILWALADTIILKTYDETDALSWMKDFSDNLLLSDIDIPGTHDSCARYGGVAYECQSMTIADQLTTGIRFLDIRCRHFENGFPIHHGAKYQNQEFVPDVMDVCLDFLQAHPRECIVMSVKEEYNAADNTETFQQTFEV